MLKRTLIPILMLLCSHLVVKAIPAFPGAEGYGADATGGRGGQVIHVTNLNASGAGSLQEAVSTSGPRIVVFDVGGVINGDILITEPNCTIAGETAPAPGITINGRFRTSYDYDMVNYIIRFIRIRPTGLSGNQGDAIQFSRASNFIFDHVNASWGSDETVDFYESQDVTIQYCFIEESATFAGHPDGDFHNYGLINGPDGQYISVHHNLFAHHNYRTPAIANGPADIVNNVVYNSTAGFVHHNPVNDDCFSFLGNYYMTGPDRPDINPYWLDDESTPYDALYYMDGNYVDDDPDYQDYLDDPFTSSYQGIFLYSTQQDTVTSPCATVSITVDTAFDAFNNVLDYSGSFPRDIVAQRTVNEVINRSGSWGRVVPQDLLEGLPTESNPTDTDGDGMPDSWETARGLNPNVADDDGDDDSDGYTNIEEYLHDRAAELIPSGDTVPSITTSSLPDGEQGVAYSETLIATGGNGTLTWSVISGSLPAGLSMSSAGVISGTPSSTGTSNFTVEVEDDDSDTDTQALSITVNVADSQPTITTSSLPDADQGSAYSETLTATGGDGTLTWSVISGSLPAGLSLSSGGVISGTPTGTGTSNFTVEVEDADNDTDSQALSITVDSSVGSTLVTIFSDTQNFTFSGGHASEHDSAVVSGEGVQGSDAIKFSNITTSSWTRLDALDFSSNPLDISGLISSDYIEISIDLGSVASPLTGIELYFNGWSWEGAPNVDLPQVDDTVGYETFQIPISSIYSSLGNSLTQVHLNHGNWPYSTVWIDEIKFVDLSGGDTTPPAAPTNLGATAGDGSVSLDWDDNTENDLDDYNVYRSTTSGSSYSSIATGVTTSNYTDNTVTNGTTYYYVVTAEDTSDNESADSSEASATPQSGSSTLVTIFSDTQNFTFSGGHASAHDATVATGEGVGGSDAIKYYNITTNNWTRIHALDFSSSPLDISSVGSSDYIEISIDLGNVASALPGIELYFNGWSWQSAPSVSVPQVDAQSGFETFQIPISSIRSSLGNTLTLLQIYQSNWPYATVWVDEIKFVD